MSGAAGRRLVIAGAGAVALGGGLLLVLTPDLDGRPGLRTLWIALALALLKLPVLGLLLWLFVRRRHARDDRWDADATTRFLDALEGEVTTPAGGPIAPSRLESLRADAWRAAEEGDPAMTPRAVEIALRIDRMRLRHAPPQTSAKIFRK